MSTASLEQRVAALEVQYAEVLESPGNLPNFDKIQETLQRLA